LSSYSWSSSHCYILSRYSFFLSVLILLLSQFLFVSSIEYKDTSACITYHSSDRTIRISCNSANLTDISNAIKNSKILKKESSNKIWLLKANLEVENRSKLYINSTDTSWLKIDSSRGKAYRIQAKGDLLIDSVKITSWDTTKKDYARSNSTGTLPRSYILVNHGDGMTNITNSEIAYLGYQHGSSFGLTYYTGAGSIIKNNKIHDLWYGFYSNDKTAHNITIQNNEFYNNSLHAMGLQSGTHYMNISNNTVHNNGRQGITCFADCYNIVIDSNKLFNNAGGEIMLKKNVSNSIIKNNIVNGNKGDIISIHTSSHNNEVSHNNIRGGEYGIRITHNSSNNTVYKNIITNSSRDGIFVYSGASKNIIDFNTINNAGYALFIQGQNTSNNIFRNNYLLNSRNDSIKLYDADYSHAILKNNTSYVEPIITKIGLKAEIVFRGLESNSDLSDLSPVTSFAFLGPNDIIVLEKNTGKVLRIVNGVMLPRPLLDVNVANEWDRGLLGVAIEKHKNGNGTSPIYIFLYFTESETAKDGTDNCPDQFHCKEINDIIVNRIYRYELVNNKLLNPHLILSLPALPGPRHNAGAIIIGPDKNVYVPVGDLGGERSSYTRTKSLNYKNGTEPDGRAGILRVTEDGQVVNGKGILGNEDPLNKYYAYGIRNSFGIDFDPVTKKLWDTENGDNYGDEINLIEPGFNSGWKEIQGVWVVSNHSLFNYNPSPKYKGYIEKKDIPLDAAVDNLVDYAGKGKYRAPEFVWNETVVPTAIKFFNSDKYGKNYENDMFVGDFRSGTLYHFDLNKNRTGLLLKGPLADRVANSHKELEGIIFGERFGKITDIEVGPYDGYLYVLSLNGDKATIFKITPIN
jgi:parallel beta-helix repeat protein